MAKKYYSMNEVPLGSKITIKSSGLKGELIEIQNFPTTFKVKDENGDIDNFYTYEVDIIDWPPKDK